MQWSLEIPQRSMITIPAVIRYPTIIATDTHLGYKQAPFSGKAEQSSLDTESTESLKSWGFYVINYLINHQTLHCLSQC
ncbi:hypothetical protein SAMN06296273_1002 [Nitrosomonas ureae]|uniref:Uncharacterized protein n=1 Tax=Nitrosomonas ureae TaxID=44577 RepID=A0A285BWH7_9PROT|nr:hypothetical protein SAMN06296273_1002 [Nitrosomonas ureae]